MSLTACSGGSSAPTAEERTIFALDTIISLSGCGSDSSRALDETEARIREMEKELSRTRPDSVVYSLNHADGRPVPVRQAVIRLLEQSQSLCALTSGSFDITIAPAADLWGFTQASFQVPTQEALEQVRNVVGIGHLHLDGNTVWLDPGSAIDLGGIAKGYALEQSLEIFRAHNLEAGLANLGGDILVYGSGPWDSLWHVGIRDPENRDGTIGTLALTDRYILTSGGYERFCEADGTQYPHILDPLTCAPADRDLKSVTVVTPMEDGCGIAADALATALFLAGSEGAAAFWEAQGRWFDMVLVGCSGTVWVTDGLSDALIDRNADAGPWLTLS